MLKLRVLTTCAAILSLLILASISIALIIHATTGYTDIDMLEKEAPVFLTERGYKIISYDGYQGKIFHGGFVWYQVRDKDNYLYVLAVGEWNDRFMIYNQRCLNALPLKSNL
ncbi:MAG: hypothetical protein JXR69_02690 [Candidatus Delongbacteria bacterium]|nr:hypothetical protein [Candidatus Delongbacteria bacterium]